MVLAAIIKTTVTIILLPSIYLLKFDFQYFDKNVAFTN